MVNLLNETTEYLARFGHTLEDIKAVQGSNLRISVEKFKALADKKYDEGYGSQHVASDLVLVMNDGSWYSRWEYDGSEGWCLHRAPEMLDHIDDDKVNVIVDNEKMWETLAGMNKMPEEDD